MKNDYVQTVYFEFDATVGISPAPPCINVGVDTDHVAAAPKGIDELQSNSPRADISTLIRGG